MHGLRCAVSGGVLLPCGRVVFPCGCLVVPCGGVARCPAWRGLAGLAFVAGVGVSVLGVGGCFRTDGRFARKRAAFGGVLRAGGASSHALRIVAVWRACGPCWRVGRGVSCQGKGAPPCRGIHVGVLPFSDFFLFFFGGGMGCGSVEAWRGVCWQREECDTNRTRMQHYAIKVSVL